MSKIKNSIGVVIPTYNRAHTITRALDSAMTQTRVPKEIVVVDDGSTDHTKEIISTYPQIRLLSQENKGVSAARNNGIRSLDTEWIALLDSDDAWSPEKLDAQIQTLKKNHKWRICHTNEIWVRRGRRVNQMNKHAKYGGKIFEQCLPLCCISPSSVLLHHTVFTDYGYFDEDLPACEDYDFWLRLTQKEEVCFVNRALTVKYGGHADQLSRQFWGMDRFRIQAMEKLLRNGGLSKQHEQATLKILASKMRIYIEGARKREKSEDVALYCQKWENIFLESYQP
ncbi:MAG: glycosyltransferase family A protein [Myxococcota bacterium]|nr:glycosyltransferase family A protein [Myxococcota bacterium]